VKSLLRRELRLGDNEEIADDTPLSGGDLDLDSLDMLLIVTAIEKEFAVKVREADAAGDDGSGDDVQGKGRGAAGAGDARGAFENVTTLAAFIEERTGGGAPEA
jgi:acyl carrier protein